MGRIRDFLTREVTAPGFGNTGVVARAAQAEVEGLLDYQVPAWYSENLGGGLYGSMYGNDRLAKNLWVANRCQHMNAQQISSMPFVYHGPDATEPNWVTDPDPQFFPNGIGDAIYYAIDQMYGYGYAILYVTARYATGYPHSWTVLPSANVVPCIENGAKVYKSGDGGYFDPGDIVQVDRNPNPVHGTSALRAYAAIGNALMAADRTSAVVAAGGYPSVYLQPKRPIDADQARDLQAQWMQRTAERGGAPPVVPPDITVEELNINPSDLQLLDSRKWDATAICTAYGTPSVLMNMSLEGGMTYQNPAALGEFWWRFELRNVATRFENALSNVMLPRDQYVTIKSDDTWAPAITEADDPERATPDSGDAAIAAPTPATQSGGASLSAVN